MSNESTPTQPDAVDTDKERVETAEAEEQATQVTPPKPEPEAPVIEAEPEPIVDDEISDADARLARLDAIAEEARAEDVPPVVEPEVVEEPTTNDVDSETEVTEPDTSELPLRRLDDGTYVTTIKVNGVEQDVPFDKVLTDAQRVAAANEKFRASATLEKENDALKAQLAQLSQQQPQPPFGVAPQAPPHGEQQGVTADIVDKAFLDGDEQAKQTLVERLNQPSINPVDIVEMVKHETRRESALEAVSKMDPVYAQILSDETLADVAGAQSQLLLDTQPQLTELENIEKAAELARVQLGLELQANQSPAPTPSTNPVESTLSNRQAAKQAHTTGNLAASSKRASVGVEAQPFSHKTEIADMRKQRNAGFG